MASNNYVENVYHMYPIPVEANLLLTETVWSIADDDATKIYGAAKNQLLDTKNKAADTAGAWIDITAIREAERLKYESELNAQRLIIEEKEKLIALAHKVAHDISSPLSALTMMMRTCDELPENKRLIIKRATENILDIANNLLNTYRNNEQRASSNTEQPQSILISDFIVQLLSEKKVEYVNSAVRFETDIANDAQFAFIHVQKIEFRRAMSNLINNAVDAMGSKEGSTLRVQLTVDADSVIIKVQDNGKGMSQDQVQKMLAHQSFTEGKEDGHGLGLQQVWDTLEYNKGTMVVQSELGNGTSIQLNFPRIAPSSWIIQEIDLAPDSIIVILDDDESIHHVWNSRFASFSTVHPYLRLHYFKHGQEVMDFLDTLSPQEKDQVIFLCDYELLNQQKNGLQVIEASQLKKVTLVTSYYSKVKILDAAAQLNVKILPKQLALVIPIHMNLAKQASQAGS